MELDYAFLAERADRLHDGRLVVFGGDADAIQPAGFPAKFQVSLVARMLLDDGENPDGHTWGVAMTSPEPDGKRKALIDDQNLNGPHDIPPGMQGGAGLIVGLTIGLMRAGIYRIHLIVDGVEVKTLPLLVENPPHITQEKVEHDSKINSAN